MTRLLAIVGPTASGKSRMAIEVAQVLGARDCDVEIVSCDSMAVYRGLDVVAAKPTGAERAGVAHHLLDVVAPSEDVTAVAYRDLARAAIGDIGSRGALPMLVGGSGLWFRAVVDPLTFAPTSAEVRARLEGEDPVSLHRRLHDADPVTAGRIDVRNVRRVVRAVEILELTGKPPSVLRADWERRDGPYDLAAAGLEWDTHDLDRRIEERVETMLACGLVEEVARELASGLSRTARQAIGIKEIADHLEGRVSLQDATRMLVRNTKRFARRQLSWFRPDPRIRWVNVSGLGWDRARDAVVEVLAA